MPLPWLPKTVYVYFYHRTFPLYCDCLFISFLTENDFSPYLSPEPQTHKCNCLPHISTYISNGSFNLTFPKQNTRFPAYQNLLRQWWLHTAVTDQNPGVILSPMSNISCLLWKCIQDLTTSDHPHCCHLTSLFSSGFPVSAFPSESLVFTPSVADTVILWNLLDHISPCSKPFDDILFQWVRARVTIMA